MATDVTDRTAAPPGPPPRPTSRWRSFPRNIWRQLTSMRTALILLFLLAVASVPGALLPQWALNRTKTQTYVDAHGWWGALLDHLGFFGVFSSPWYAAIYLLLFTSLVGCLLPRSWEFARTLGQPPVVTPRNLSRLPLHDVRTTTRDVDAATAHIRAGLRGWRTVRRDEADGVVTLSAEKGYLREVGNLVFHLSLLGLLVAVAAGKLFGYEASVIVTSGLPGIGSQFCSQAGAYDEFRPGVLVDGTDMTPFCLNVDSFSAQYTGTGAATAFSTQVRSSPDGKAPLATWPVHTVEVNDPLSIAGQRVYLLGHGYSPTFTVTYPGGTTQSSTVPFTPEDDNFTSQGAVKFLDPPGYTSADQRKHQLAVVGVFAPTANVHGGLMTSTYPAAEHPGVAVDIYRGDVGLDSGNDQSIFAIDMNQVSRGLLAKQARVNLLLGESTTLDDGTKVTFSGVHEWVSLQTTYDPGQLAALICAILLLAGLMTSLTIKRRRVWFRLVPTGPPAGPQGAGTRTVESVPTTRIEVGGLARTDQAGYGAEFTRLTALAGDPVGPAGPTPAGVRGWR